MEPLDVSADERVEPCPPHRPLQQRHEQRALLVGHRRVHVVGVHALQVRAQHGVRRVRPEARHRLVERHPADRPAHGGRLRPVQRLEDPALRPDREPLVQPEMVHRGVGHEVAGPRVGQLVRHHVHQRAVARQQRRREERQPRVLHAAVRERRRQHQHVVAVPLVRAEHLLRGQDHLLDAGELPGRGLHRRRLRPHPRPRAQVARGEIAHRERDQVRRNRLRHREAHRPHPRLGADRLTLRARPTSPPSAPPAP